jgi:hypothetical protein
MLEKFQALLVDDGPLGRRPIAPRTFPNRGSRVEIDAQGRLLASVPRDLRHVVSYNIIRYGLEH